MSKPEQIRDPKIDFIRLSQGATRAASVQYLAAHPQLEEGWEKKLEELYAEEAKAKADEHSAERVKKKKGSK